MYHVRITWDVGDVFKFPAQSIKESPGHGFLSYCLAGDAKTQL